MPQHIGVDHSLCTGCRECEVVCSLRHFGECNPDRSAIRVLRKESEGLAVPLPLVCQHCDQPACLEACPVEALSRSPETGRLTVDGSVCTGCGSCAEACPAGCLFMDGKDDIILCCDLCRGETWCVTLCHSGCLTLSDGLAETGEVRVQRLADIREAEFQRAVSAASGGK